MRAERLTRFGLEQMNDDGSLRGEGVWEGETWFGRNMTKVKYESTIQV